VLIVAPAAVSDGGTVKASFEAAENVAVRLVCPPGRLPVLHGVVVPEQVPTTGDQPANADSALGVAVTAALAPLLERLRLHDPTIVTVFVPVPEAPVQAPLPVVGYEIVPALATTVTEPPPAPLKVKLRFLAWAT
jgi:hypothetical protein